MNFTRRLASAFVLSVVGWLALTGCTAQLATSPEPSEESTGTRPPDVLAPCNLGEKFDSVAMERVARYETPAVDPNLVEEYGLPVANGSCSDAAIIKWQELRREVGESDAICRVTWYDDYFSAVTYPIGCAVPVLAVTDAVR